VGGLDDPGKVLSSERDVMYVNQAEELTLDAWETILTRCTGRAGHVPYPQLLGDCNPSYPRHWIKERSGNGGALRLLESRHEDNPTLFDPETQQITPQGVRTMAILDSLTGTRKERLRFGRWVQAEGVVYDAFDERIHLVDRFAIPKTWRRIRCVDFGLKNPFVCGWWAIDPDGRMYLYREIYMTGRTVMEHAPQIISYTGNEIIEATPCDHDAEDAMTLHKCGVKNTPAIKGDVVRGIQQVQDRLKVQKDGKPRLMLMRGTLVEVDQELKAVHKPICTLDEFGCYIWNDKSRKDEPVKQNDHGMDMMRYAVQYVDSRSRGTSNYTPKVEHHRDPAMMAG
jgi:phage terminase large subunit